MAGSNGTEVEEVAPQKLKSLPFISVSDRQARFLSGMVTLIFTVYFTTLLLVFVAFPLLRLFAKLIGSPRF